MNDLIIKGIKTAFFTPTVKFIVATGKCTITGEAHLENTVEFFKPLYDWLYEYMNKINKQIIFEINLRYFNTRASRSIFDMLFILRKYVDNGGDVTVNWYCDKDDQDMLDEIADYLEDTGLEISQIIY